MLASFISGVTLVVVGIDYLVARRQFLRDARERLTREATALAAALHREAAERVRAASVWPRLDAAQDVAIEDVDKRYARTLQQLAQRLGVADLAIAADTEQRIIASSDARLAGASLRAVPWARDARCADSATVRTRRDVDGSRLVVTAAIRRTSDGARIGCLFIATPWRQLVAAAVPAEVRSSVVVTTGGDTVWAGSDLAAHARLVSGQPASSADATLPFTIVAAEPQEAALAPVRERGRRALWLAFIVMGVTLPAGAIVALTTTRPLRALTDAAADLNAGGSDLPEPERSAPAEVHALHAALDGMLARLEQSRVQLAERETLAALGTWSAALAHELRTPIASVHGSLELLARAGADVTRQAEVIEIALDELRRLERLVTDLLAFASPRAPDRRPADLARIGARAVGVVSQLARDRHVAVEITGTAAEVVADDEQLEQVAINLLRNAIEHSPAGASVTLTTGIAGSEARLEVQDRGPGIPSARDADIWKPFHTTRARGTGLGLAIVRRIVDQHEGTAAALPRPGGGTIMRVSLPRRVGADQHPPVPTLAPSARSLEHT